jgi:hypothetical protein
MTSDEALKAFNDYMCNAGLVLIRKQDVQRIRDLAMSEGFLDKLKALDIQVWQEFSGEIEEIEEEAPLVPLIFSKK